MVEANPYGEHKEETHEQPQAQEAAHEEQVQPQTHPEQPSAQVVYVQTFKSSELDKPKEMHEYLLKRLEDPYNKYCIDCKRNTSTHCLVLYGAFVCANCANMHRQMFGFFNTYPKDLLTEQFDDYQLAAVAEQIGGNKPIYDLFVEFQIQAEDSFTRFNHKAFAWYKRRHAASITGVIFNEEKPSKSFGEAVDKYGGKAKKAAGEVVEDIKNIDKEAVKSTISGWWRKIRGTPAEEQPNLSHDPQPAEEQKHE